MEVNGGLRCLDNDLEVPICRDMFLFFCRRLISLSEILAKYILARQVSGMPSLSATAEPRVKMKPVNTECELLFLWLLSWYIFSAM